MTWSGDETCYPLSKSFPHRLNGPVGPQGRGLSNLYRENVPMAERFSNALDTGWAYVMGPRLFERSYKPSPKLVVVESPHEHTVNVSQWIREFITDVEGSEKWKCNS
ncbi:hypothetical protein TNCT_319861 [Trichonephila clavata]|uniref:Uncharacterized protein n=1 Tax=Trichonephila clavata TaxID=2740835 RepID=A0A8X6KA25_TRICU|nr:hypothetical protein TNCT_319861 [Trichonephila clavata]